MTRRLLIGLAIFASTAASSFAQQLPGPGIVYPVAQPSARDPKTSEPTKAAPQDRAPVSLRSLEASQASPAGTASSSQDREPASLRSLEERARQTSAEAAPVGSSGAAVSTQAAAAQVASPATARSRGDGSQSSPQPAAPTGDRAAAAPPISPQPSSKAVVAPAPSADARQASSSASPFAATAPGANADVPSSQPARPSATTSTRPDGTRVIRAQVPSSFAEAESAVAQTLPVPSVPVAVATGAAPSATQPSSSDFASSLKPVPAWVAGGVDKSAGKTSLTVSQGVTEVVKIARNFPNRFITPFESAEVVTTDDSVVHSGAGGAVIIATSSDKPIGIFLQDQHSDRAIGLVLVPEDIPQRELRFLLDDTWAPPVLRSPPDASPSAPQLPSAQSDYVEHLKMIMRSMAKGEVPDGHALSVLQPQFAPACQMPGLTLTLSQMLEGPTTRIAVYVAANRSASTVPIQEAGCYRQGTLAAGAFPRAVLEPGEATEVYVVLRKETEATTRASAKRRPVLVQ